jgi:hypothetical protein
MRRSQILDFDFEDTCCVVASVSAAPASACLIACVGEPSQCRRTQIAERSEGAGISGETKSPALAGLSFMIENYFASFAIWRASRETFRLALFL